MKKVRTKTLIKYKSQFFFGINLSLRRLVTEQIENDYERILAKAESNITSNSTRFWSFVNTKKWHSGMPGTARELNDMFYNKEFAANLMRYQHNSCCLTNSFTQSWNKALFLEIAYVKPILRQLNGFRLNFLGTF